MPWRKLWFHEDDFAGIQFLPSSCRDFCLYQLDQIRRHDEAHRAPDGVGWTKMYNLPAPPASIADLGIKKSDLAAAMPWRLQRTNNVLTGSWSEAGERLPNTAAYMAGHCGIVFTWNESGIVTSLWFKDGYISRWHRSPLLGAFFRIGILAPLLLVDWRGTVIDLGDQKAIRAYLDAFGPAAPRRQETAPDIAAEAARANPPEPAPPPSKDSIQRFDCSVRAGLVTRKYAAGPVQVVLYSADERSWALSLDNATLRGGTPPVPAAIRLAGDAPVLDWTDLAGDTIVTCRNHGGREMTDICDLRDGSIVHSTPEPTAVLTPDARHLLIFEDEGIAVVDLSEPSKPARQSGLFPIGQEDTDDTSGRVDMTLDSPSSAMAVAPAPNAETFTLAIGDYGFAVAAKVRIGGADEPPLVVAEPAHLFSESLVYDPVEIVNVVPDESLVVRHGHGTGVARCDLRSGRVVDCPLPAEIPERRYAGFQQVVASNSSPMLWLRTSAGPRLWDGAGPLRRVQDKAPRVLATDGDWYIALSPDRWDLVRGRFSNPPRN